LNGIYCCETWARVVCGTLVLLDRVGCCGSSRRWGWEVFRTDYRMGTCRVLELDCIVEVRRSEGKNRTKFIVEEEEIRWRETEIGWWGEFPRSKTDCRLGKPWFVPSGQRSRILEHYLILSTSTDSRLELYWSREHRLLPSWSSPSSIWTETKKLFK
jgi:hypothetical protein